jgi:hypothetical protein
MAHDFFDPTPEQQNVVLVNAATLREAEQLIESCEHCNEEGAEIPFDNILDRVTGSDPSVTDYILESPAKCPNCRCGLPSSAFSHDCKPTPPARSKILPRSEGENAVHAESVRANRLLTTAPQGFKAINDKNPQ